MYEDFRDAGGLASRAYERERKLVLTDERYSNALASLGWPCARIASHTFHIVCTRTLPHDLGNASGAHNLLRRAGFAGRRRLYHRDARDREGNILGTRFWCERKKRDRQDKEGTGAHEWSVGHASMRACRAQDSQMPRS